MNAMLQEMNPTANARLRSTVSWHAGGSAPISAGGVRAAFQSSGNACGGMGEQRKGRRVSASGEVV
jgi:hypothetical protein